MVFEPNFTKVVSSVRRNVGVTQSVIELKLPTNENNVSKVYSIGAKSTVISSEANGRELSFMGLIDFQAVYEGDGISAVDYSVEFRDKFEADQEIMGELIVTSNVVDVTSEIVAGDMKVVAIVEITLDEISSRDLNVLTSAKGEGVHVSTSELTFSSYIGKAYEKFDVAGDLQIDGAAGVLMVTPCVSLYEVLPRDNYIIVNGKLNLDICYKTGDNVQDINTKYHEMDFSWEVALDGLTANSIVQSVVGLVSNEIKVSTIIEEGVANINVYVPVVYAGYVFNESTIDVVGDLYLEKNYMSVTCENFDTIMGNDSVKFKDNISGTASILDTSPFIDEIIGVCTNNLVLASSRVENNKLYIEGVANSTVVYYTKETNDVTSVQVEMPFSVEEKVIGECSSVVTICLENISARSKRGKEIEVSAELNVYTDMYSNNTLSAITSVNIGDEKQQDDCSLYIYIVKEGQTIWDVAKDVNTSQELILDQNPDIELPLKGGEKLVIYKPNIMKF